MKKEREVKKYQKKKISEIFRQYKNEQNKKKQKN